MKGSDQQLSKFIPVLTAACSAVSSVFPDQLAFLTHLPYVVQEVADYQNSMK